MLELRPYQREAIDGLYAYWQDGGGNGVIVLPTGAGKSLVIATICRELLEQWSDMRIGIVTHVKELIAQNAQELISSWRQAPVGIYSAGLRRRDAHARILFAGIQSVHNKAHLLGGFDLLLIDEAHLVPRDADTRYGRFIRDCLKTVPDMRIVGLTATDYRLQGGRLTSGKDKLFDDVVYEANVGDLIKDGYLSKLRSPETDTQVSTKGLHIRDGDYNEAEMSARHKVPTVVQTAVAEMVEAGQDRRGWLAFCSDVEHAHQVAAEIRTYQVSCETITGETPNGERDSIIARYKRREILCLTSVGVLTTGFNAPHVDLIALMRSTLSTGLYVQMVGRGLRKTDGKSDCLVLDFGGNIRKHGPINAVRPNSVGGGGGKEDAEPAPVRETTVAAKVCPTCKEYAAVHQPTCEFCGFEWPVSAAQHAARADTAPILADAPPPKKQADMSWMEIRDMSFARHEKRNAPPSLRITYTGQYQSQSEWLCFEHSGFPRERAVMVWGRLGGGLPTPASVDEALTRTHELRAVSAIKVKQSGQYLEVVSRMTEDRPAAAPAAIEPADSNWPTYDADDEIPF